MRRLLAGFVAILLAGGARADESLADEPASQEQLRSAVARALPLLTKGAVGHRENRTCFACHNQGLPILAMVTAKSRGIAIDDEEVARQLRFIADFLGKNREGYLQGKGQGGQADMAGYALLTLELGGWRADETTAAVTEFLLLRHADRDHYASTSQRPPSEASPFTTSYVALRGLAHFGTPEQRERIGKRTEQVRDWLVKTPAQDHEDRVFRLFGLRLAGAPQSDIDAAVKELLAKQRDDGGWSQLDGGEPKSATETDAYATGTALVALHQAGEICVCEEPYQRGIAYLLSTQLDDGTWRVASRSKPFQTYFETGFPHGKDQFISAAASAWATTALALACAARE
ncbi:MAG: prenyltransferase/squalene oxidase repeat-containing protein [Pirellulaceae bacterium]|nr:prenyltransferase/squalene oxidase repeat-containing protein [Pirellulaceae bacterium]